MKIALLLLILVGLAAGLPLLSEEGTIQDSILTGGLTLGAFLVGFAVGRVSRSPKE